MSILNQLQDFYKRTITQTTGAGAGKIYVSAKPTPTNGYLVISPTNAVLREIVKYTGTGTDSGGDYVTIANIADRGLGGTSAQVHNAGESIRMNMTSKHWADLITELTAKLDTSVDFPDTASLKAYIDGISLAGGAIASTITMGLVRMSYNSDVALGNCTITIANPAVITKTAHGLTANDIVQFSTTGTLPTGLTAGVKYYVLSAGLTTDDFRVSLSAGGTAVETTVAGSGTHSVTKVTPIAVSPNDPLFNRLPSTGEKTAIAGKSGSAVGTLNKLIDEAMLYSGSTTDQSQATQNTALKVGEADATAKQNLIAQSFVAGKSPLKTVSLYKRANTGTFTGDVVVTIQADVSGSPSGVALATVTITNATYNALSNDATFAVNLASNLNLDIGSTYWIVVDPTTSDNSNYINLGYQNTNVYASGALKYKNVTDGWVSVTGDLYFVLTIDPSGKVPVLDSTGKLPVSVLPAIGKFGGTGADGALTISSGTTTLDLGGQQYFEKNYSSISITGTGSLAFTNPHANGTIIIIKCSGDCVLTSSNPAIDTTGMGAAGGAGVGTQNTAGNNGSLPTMSNGVTQTGSAGLGGATNGAGPKNGVVYPSGGSATVNAILLSLKSPIVLAAGAGGGSGSVENGGSGSSGAGGRGGGALYLEVGGGFNFTGSLKTNGQNGADGTGNSGSGGGGGSAGTLVVLYNTLIANTGTLVCTGGNGGTSVNNGYGNGGGGGAGSALAAGGDMAGGSTNGNPGSLGSGGGGTCNFGGTPRTGGAGGTNGASLVAKNNYFA